MSRPFFTANSAPTEGHELRVCSLNPCVLMLLATGQPPYNCHKSHHSGWTSMSDCQQSLTLISHSSGASQTALYIPQIIELKRAAQDNEWRYRCYVRGHGSGMFWGATKINLERIKNEELYVAGLEGRRRAGSN